MAEHFVFARFFPGFSESFPYEQYTSLKDAELCGAVEALRLEWLSQPEHVQRLQLARAEHA